MNNGDILSVYDRNQHSVYMLYYHLILVVKYRRKVLDDDVSGRAKEIFPISVQDTASRWKNGTMIPIISTSCFGLNLLVNSVSSLMLIKVPAAVF